MSYIRRSSLDDIQRSIEKKKLKQRQKSKKNLQGLSRQTSPKRNTYKQEISNKMIDSKLVSVNISQTMKTNSILSKANYSSKIPFSHATSTPNKKNQSDNFIIKIADVIKLADQAMDYIDKSSQQARNAVLLYKEAKQKIMKDIKGSLPSFQSYWQKQKQKQKMLEKNVEEQTLKLSQQNRRLKQKIFSLSSAEKVNAKDEKINDGKMEHQIVQEERNKYKQSLQWMLGDQKIGLFKLLKLQMDQFIEFKQNKDGSFKLEEFLETTHIIRSQRKKLCQKIHNRDTEIYPNGGTPHITNFNLK